MQIISDRDIYLQMIKANQKENKQTTYYDNVQSCTEIIIISIPL